MKPTRLFLAALFLAIPPSRLLADETYRVTELPSYNFDRISHDVGANPMPIAGIAVPLNIGSSGSECSIPNLQGTKINLRPFRLSFAFDVMRGSEKLGSIFSRNGYSTSIDYVDADGRLIAHAEREKLGALIADCGGAKIGEIRGSGYGSRYPPYEIYDVLGTKLAMADGKNKSNYVLRIVKFQPLGESAGTKIATAENTLNPFIDHWALDIHDTGALDPRLIAFTVVINELDALNWRRHRPR